jgi:hypothetical protein
MVRGTEQASTMTINYDSGYERIANDLYETPEWVTDILIDHMKVHHPAVHAVWEPAAGNRKMANRLLEAGFTVTTSDKNEYPNLAFRGVDFITTNAIHGKHIVTNPPYGRDAQPFVEKALRIAWAQKGFVAMLLNTNWAHARSRRHLFAWNEAFASKIEIHKRIVWVARTDGVKEAPKGNHAWFIWDWNKIAGPAKIYWR